jgi:hypothetical protein
MYTKQEIDAWLGPLTDPSMADSKRLMTRMTSQIWTVQREGRTWAAACDSRVLVLVAGKHGYDDAPSEGAKQYLELFDKPTSETGAVALAELQEWAGPPPSREPVECVECNGAKVVSCHECDGEGTVECEFGHEHTCDECNGNGKHGCDACNESGKAIPEWEIDGGVICGRMVDRHRLTHAMRGCRDQELTISACKDWLRIHSANTEAILMGINQKDLEAPVFKPRSEKG